MIRVFIGESYFFSDGAQPYLIFHTFYYSFRRILITVKVISWESKDLSESIVTPNNNLSATIKWYRNLNFSLVSKGSCLKQDRAAFSCRNIINVYVFCELDTWS